MAQWQVQKLANIVSPRKTKYTDLLTVYIFWNDGRQKIAHICTAMPCWSRWDFTDYLQCSLWMYINRILWSKVRCVYCGKYTRLMPFLTGAFAVLFHVRLLWNRFVTVCLYEFNSLDLLKCVRINDSDQHTRDSIIMLHHSSHSQSLFLKKSSIWQFYQDVKSLLFCSPFV